MPSNDYFDSADYTAMVRLTNARAEAVNAALTAVENGFALLPSKTRLYEGRVTYCGTAGGTPNALTVTAPYTITLTDGLHIRFKAASLNTGAATINPSSLGATNLRDYSGAALVGGELVGFVDAVYDSSGPYFRIINPVVDIASVSVTNNAKVTTADTTPGVLNDKVTVSGALTKSVGSPGGNETLALAVAALALTAGTRQTASFNASSNTIYPVAPASNVSVTYPASPSDGDVLGFAVYDTGSGYTFSINPNGKKVNGSTSTLNLGVIAKVFFTRYDSTLGDWT